MVPETHTDQAVATAPNRHRRRDYLLFLVRSICIDAVTIEEASQAVQDAVAADDDLRREFVERALPGFAYDLVSETFRKMRRAIVTVRQDTSQGGLRLLQTTDSLLEFPLWDGTRLKEATRVQVIETAEKYESQATTMAHRGRWLRAVAAKATNDDERIGDVVDAATAQQLFEAA